MLIMIPFGRLKQNNEYNMKLSAFEAPLRMVVVGCKWSEWSGRKEEEEAKIQIAVWIKYKLILNKFFSLASCPTFSLSTFIRSWDVCGGEKREGFNIHELPHRRKVLYIFARNAIKMITIRKRPFGKSVECCRSKISWETSQVFRCGLFLSRTRICSLQSISIWGEI